MQSLVPFNLLIFNLYDELLEEWQFESKSDVVYMKKHVAIVTVRPVVN